MVMVHRKFEQAGMLYQKKKQKKNPKDDLVRAARLGMSENHQSK